ncbi:hypothetical protein EVJ58_g3214 [Rhodofomes roseus]|uniref:Uncharacterized protein n=1 Tax=Rhodofomes roseus TaxID=34475 RepID=A0A4Y9YLQ6_9APHY|nr:hypothetical protein EVJ58_g3214 [Rhodofomes roseus]
MDHAVDDIASNLTSFEKAFYGASATFKNLLTMNQKMRALHGDAPDPAFTLQGQHNRAAPSNMPTSLHLQLEQSHILDLDYDGAPSGFATSLLRIDGSAHGVGISVRPEASRNRTGIDPQIRERFQDPERDEDVCRIADSQATIRNTPPGGFGLVLANAALDLPEDVTSWTNSDVHLIYAQLLVTLQYVALGGSLVICLPTRPLSWVVDVIAILRQAFDELHITAVNLAPDDQARRPLAYVVCHRCGASDGTKRIHISRLQTVIQSLRRTSVSSGPLAPCLSGVPENDILVRQKEFVLKLFGPVWKGQHDAVYKQYLALIGHGHGDH